MIDREVVVFGVVVLLPKVSGQMTLRATDPERAGDVDSSTATLTDFGDYFGFNSHYDFAQWISLVAHEEGERTIDRW